MAYSRSCQRKLGGLTAVSEEYLKFPDLTYPALKRTVSGDVALEELLKKLGEVRGACFPDRGFVRIKVVDFYATMFVPSTFAWLAFDTNAHGRYQGRKVWGAFKNASSYKRPSRELCDPGHVGICWGYRGSDGHSFFASLASGAAGEALRELEALHGTRPERIEVRVQIVWLKPADGDSRRAFMSWGAAPAFNMERRV